MRRKKGKNLTAEQATLAKRTEVRWHRVTTTIGMLNTYWCCFGYCYYWFCYCYCYHLYSAFNQEQRSESTTAMRPQLILVSLLRFDILLFYGTMLMIQIGQRLEGHLRQPDCHVTRCADLRHNDVIIVQTIYSSPWWTSQYIHVLLSPPWTYTSINSRCFTD